MEDDESDAVTFADLEDEDEISEQEEEDFPTTEVGDPENDDLLQFSQTGFETVEEMLQPPENTRQARPRSQLVRQSSGISLMLPPKEFDELSDDDNSKGSWDNNDESGAVVFADPDDEEENKGGSESSASSDDDSQSPEPDAESDTNEKPVERLTWSVKDYYMGGDSCFDEWKKHVSKEKLEEIERRRNRRRDENSD